MSSYGFPVPLLNSAWHLAEANVRWAAGSKHLLLGCCWAQILGKERGNACARTSLCTHSLLLGFFAHSCVLSRHQRG